MRPRGVPQRLRWGFSVGTHAAADVSAVLKQKPAKPIRQGFGGQAGSRDF